MITDIFLDKDILVVYYLLVGAFLDKDYFVYIISISFSLMLF
jgi:hypothetical protein